MEQLAYTMVRNPVRITIAPEKPTLEAIEQSVMFVGRKNKDALLSHLIRETDIKKVIVFTQMKHVANRVVKKLETAGVHSSAIHGNKSQSARLKALDGFKRGRFNVLVATDVAARGIDVDNITHVINYDLPMEAETYVHRIGRTARAGASGHAISFCSAEERSYLRDIERLLGASVPAEREHAYHCEDASRSTQAPPKNFGRGGGGGGGGGGGRKGGGGGGGRSRSQNSKGGARRRPRGGR